MSTPVVKVSVPTKEEIEEWWRWVLSKPKDQNPLIDGKFVEVGQEGLTNWCLTCTGGGSLKEEDHERSLDVSKEEKNILIPVFVAAYCEEEIDGKAADPIAYARSLVNPNGISGLIKMPHTKENIQIHLNVDGNPLEAHYIETGPFSIVPPEHHICDCEQDLKDEKCQFYSAGWWSKIPHPSGKGYTIEFGGANDARPFRTRVTYKIKG
jgi:hypothetical protein